MERRSAVRGVFLALFFLSGISGLIYQIVWTRDLVLVFGNTLLANSTVLTAFMAGLAAGSYVLGELIDRRPRRLLRLYALLEAGIGLFGLAFPLLLAAATPLYTWLYEALGGSLLPINLFRFLLCFLLILVPTFLMGGTLPVLLKRFVGGLDTIGYQVGYLYGLNTAGAVAGCVAAGHWLLGSVGMRPTVWIAVAINLGVAAIALVLARGDEEAEAAGAARAEAAEIPPGGEIYGRGVVTAVLVGIALSGFCALAYEVLWVRMLNLFLNNNVYSFTATIATFLAGIAIGSLLYAQLLSGVRARLRLFAGIEIGIGLLAYLTPHLFTLLQQPLFSQRAESFTLAKTAVIMIAPTVLMGIAVPLAIQICQWGRGREGRSVGVVYAFNTLGSILGAFVAGFVLVPAIGLHNGLITISALNVAAGVAVLGARASRPRRLLPVAAGALLVATLFWIAPPSLFRDLYLAHNPDSEILHYKEGKVVNVVVYDFHGAGYRDLHLNGIEEASSRLWHVQLFKLLGILPVIAHEDPDEALMIAFGAGMSAGACIDHVSRLDCVDLNPDIGGPAELFRPENRNVIDNPKLRLIVNDGRNELLLSPRRYSVIISDATNPKMFDSWTLYTREFYELTRERLLPGGVFAQWLVVPLPGDSVKVILNTFRSVYPHMSLWCIYGSTQCLMLGTPERLRFDYEELSKRLEPILESSGLAEYGVDSVPKFLSFLLLGEDEVAEALAGFDKVSTDDLPHPQFALRSGPADTRTMLDILEHQAFVDRYLEPAGRLPDGVADQLDALHALARRLTLGLLLGDRREFLLAGHEARLAGLPPDANVASVLRHDRKRREHFERRIATHPDDANAFNNLGYIHAMNGDLDASRRAYERALALQPEFSNARANLAGVLIEAGAFDEAEAMLLALREENPTSRTLGLVRYRLGLVRLRRRLSHLPEDPSAHAALRDHYGRGGELSKALDAAAAAAAADPQNAALRLELARLYEGLQLDAPALAAYRRAAELSPANPLIASRIRFLEGLRADRVARREWLNEREIVLDEAPADSGHPRSCARARTLWNAHEFQHHIETDRLRRVARLFESAIRAEPEHLHAYLDAARIYEALGEPGRGAELLRRAEELDAEDRAIGLERRRLGLLAALDDGPEDPEERAALHFELGQLERRLGRPELAIRSFRAALEAGGPAHTAALALARACLEAGRISEGRRVLVSALAAGPGEPAERALHTELRRIEDLWAAYSG